jgi:hypothetical protein
MYFSCLSGSTTETDAGGSVLAASGARVWTIHMGATKPDFTCKCSLASSHAEQTSPSDIPTNSHAVRFATTMLCSVIENHVAILVACAPSIKIIALLVFPKLTSSLGKLASRITPPTPSFPSWSTRSRSRASIPLGTVDTESGQSRPPSKNQARKTSVISKGDDIGEVRVVPGQPEEMYSRNGERRPSRASRGFARWFERHERHALVDGTDDMGLVYVEHSFSVERSVRTPDR